MKTPLLSIIIPVYNAEHNINKLVNRVLGQKFQDFELLLIDDGSTDNSLKIIKTLAKKDSRITVVHKANGGPSSARNQGLKRVRGKYVMLFDADDDIDPAMITKMTTKIMKEQTDLVTCSILFNYIKKGRVISSVSASPRPALKQRPGESFTNYIVRLVGTDGRLYNPCNKIYRAELIRKHGLHYETGLHFGEDLTFNLHYLKVVRSMAFIEEPLYIYNFNLAENISGKSSLIYENRLKNYKEVVAFAGNSPSTETQDLLGWIKYFWFYSFVLALCSSKLSRKERIKRLRAALSVDELPRPGAKIHIGKKKRFMESFFYRLRRHPRVMYSLVSFIDFCKNNRLFAVTWRKVASKLLR
jgi:glycosyltransferase involved in cell wall biosynthesis